MTREDFSKMKLEEKLETVKAHGRFITSRYHLSFEVLLYAIDNFLVEVWKRAGLNYIQWIEVVNSQAVLDRYLGNINLDDLI
jgi:hypothetical protein